MARLSNEEAFSFLREHKDFEAFLAGLSLENYPGISLEQVFYLVSTGVAGEGMPVSSLTRLLEDIHHWCDAHSHGGTRTGAGAPKRTKAIKKITLSAEEDDIVRAKEAAKAQGASLQKLFREWLCEVGQS
jgi:hypothetical protein